MSASPSSSSQPSPPSPPPAPWLEALRARAQRRVRVLLRRRPPGPAPHQVASFLLGFGRDPLGTLERGKATWGDVVYMPMPGESVYVLSHPEAIEQVLLRQAERFMKSRMTRDLSALLGQGLLTSEGALWKRQRRLVSPPLQRSHIAHYATDMVALTDLRLEVMPPGTERDVHADMMALTLDIAVRTLFGGTLSSDAEAVGRHLEVALGCFQKRWQTWRRLLPEATPLPLQRRLERAGQALDAILLRTIAQARREAASGEAGEGPASLLSLLVRARDEGGGMDDAQLRDEAITFFLAGHETTALALSYALYEVSRRPSVEGRLREELEGVLGERAPGLEDVSRLPYLGAVVRETLRLYPPAWGVGREALDDVEVSGYLIPRGSQVIIPQWLVQRDERWFESAQAFVPERWLDGLERRLARFAWFPFGGGPRVCIGNHFALMETVLVLARLLQRRRVHAVAQTQLRLEPSVTLRPAGPIVLRLESALPSPAPSL